uniref:Uncharacterized protein n=1 Tax=Leersia perrieri TaxID=77586 RepID=A0A0D9VEN1_9ORYZ
MADAGSSKENYQIDSRPPAVAKIERPPPAPTPSGPYIDWFGEDEPVDASGTPRSLISDDRKRKAVVIQDSEDEGNAPPATTSSSVQGDVQNSPPSLVLPSMALCTTAALDAATAPSASTPRKPRKKIAGDADPEFTGLPMDISD